MSARRYGAGSAMDAFAQIGATRDRSAPYLAAARKRGMHAVLIETPDYLAYRKAMSAPIFDQVIGVQKPDNPEAVLEAIKDIANLRMILPGFERYVESSFSVSRFLGHPVAPSALPIDKHQQRKSILSAGANIAQPNFFAANLKDHKILDASGLKMPVVVKPVDGAGGLGVYLAHNYEELKLAISNLRRLRNYGGSDFSRLIVEEYVGGTEVSMQGIARNGQADVVSICEKQIGYEPNFKTQTCGFRELGHIVRNEKHSDQFVALANSCLQVFQYSDGPFHIDAIEQNDGCLCFLEMGYRLSGACIVNLVENATGRRLAEETFSCILCDDDLGIRQVARHNSIGQVLVAQKEVIQRARKIQYEGLEIEVTEFDLQPILSFGTIPSLVADLDRHAGFAGRVRVMGSDWRLVKAMIQNLNLENTNVQGT